MACQHPGLSGRFIHLPFVAKFLLLFSSLYSFHLCFIGLISPGGFYTPFLNHHLNYIGWWTRALVESAAALLKITGYQAHSVGNRLWTSNSAGIVLSYSCLGYGVFSFFSAFILSWPQRSKSKILFLTGGFFALQLLNIGRLAALTVYGHKSFIGTYPDHHLIFNTIIYLLTILSIWWWVDKSAERIL